MQVREHKLDGGGRTFEIRSGEIGYRSLLCRIRKTPGATVLRAVYDPMTDDSQIEIDFRGARIEVCTPFSDYMIDCTSDPSALDEFIHILSEKPIRWWERIF